MKRNFIRDQAGEVYIDVAITILIVFVFMASLMALFPIFTTQQSLNQTAKYISRTVELYGKADDEILHSVIENENFIEPDNIAIETDWENATEKTIQLKTAFTITVDKAVPIVIMRPALGDPFVINVNISASSRGISEVYWK